MFESDAAMQPVLHNDQQFTVHGPPPVSFWIKVKTFLKDMIFTRPGSIAMAGPPCKHHIFLTSSVTRSLGKEQFNFKARVMPDL